MFKSKAHSVTNPKPLTMSRVAYIELNDGRRIGLSMGQDCLINLMQSTYGMSPVASKQFAADIKQAFTSGSL